MRYVTKNGDRRPFSKGILATSLDITGLPLDTRYEIVMEIDRELEGVDQIPSKEIGRRVRRKLLDNGLDHEERFYRVTRQLPYLEKPLVIMIGGVAGTGKSTLSIRLAHSLDITRIIGTDTVREIMRNMVSKELVPTLHESSFDVDNAVNAPFVDDPLVYGFNQQVGVVSTGVKAVIDRVVKEGENAIIDGVHMVPGSLEMNDRTDCFGFQYVLELQNVEEHKKRFESRAQWSNRDPQRYINRLEEIRALQDNIIKQAEENGATVLTNTSLEETIREILEDLTTELESEVNKDR